MSKDSISSPTYPASVSTVASTIVLAKKMGAIGCAIAIGGAIILGQGIIMNIYYQSKQNIDIIMFWKEIGKMLIVPALITVVGYFISNKYNFNSMFLLITGITLFTGLYIPCLWKFSINDYERNLLKTPFLKLSHRL